MKIVTIGKIVLWRKSDGKYLILRSSKWEERPDRSQQFDLPGGVVEEGETVEEGTQRELFEETGISLSITASNLVYAHSFIFEDKEAVSRLIFFAEIEGTPDVVLSWEHEEYIWITAEEVLNLKIRQPYPEVFSHVRKIGLLV